MLASRKKKCMDSLIPAYFAKNKYCGADGNDDDEPGEHDELEEELLDVLDSEGGEEESMISS
jgi:hypothetical protein